MLVPLADWENPVRRRLLALVAIQNRDVGGLLELHATYMALKSAKRAGVSVRTMEAYELGFRDFMEWLWPSDTPAPRFQLHEATGDQIDAWINSLQSGGGHLVEERERKPLKPSSVASLLSGVKSLFKALEWAGVSKPLTNKPPPDPTPREERRPALPVRLYNKLLRHLEAGDGGSATPTATPTATDAYWHPARRRDHLAARLMGEAGLRISEAVGLELADVLLEEALIAVKGKGGRLRSVPLSRSLLQELRDWLRVRGVHARADQTRLLVNLGGRRGHGRGITAQTLRTAFRGHYEALGFPARYYGVHMLRHTAGTKMYRHSRDLYATARLLGHADVNTSAVYAKMDIEGLRELVEGMEREAERQAEQQAEESTNPKENRATTT